MYTYLYFKISFIHIFVLKITRYLYNEIVFIEQISSQIYLNDLKNAINEL